MIGRLVLAVALLAGWQAALEHPLTHVSASGELVHLRDGHAHDGDSGGSAPAACDALAALTACAAQASLPLVAPGPEEYSFAPQRPPALRVADAPPFLSQGPPACA